ncbi:PilN domain-containing protein [Candidatus Daviesbacteria bacterium]|nr:PilN domain-containing protein [Candidatus Daviesbacteria bacterium]
MAAARTPRLNINLLYPQGIPLKLLARIIKWLLTFGRYIGIVVEILVLATFAARFKFDGDLADVNENINKQIPYIESLTTQENLIRQTQFKLSIIKNVLTATPSWQDILSKISNQLPAGIKVTTINFDHSQSTDNQVVFKITGSALSNSDLAVFLSGLNSVNSFKEINLTNISLGDTGFTFTITGVAK